MGLFSFTGEQPATENAPEAPVLDAPITESGNNPSPEDILARHPAQERKRKKRSDAGVPRGAREGKTEPVGADVSPGVQVPSIAAEQIASAIKSLISVVDGRVCASIKRTAIKITNDHEFARELAESVAMQPVEVETISSLTVIVINKYNILGTYAPECLLAVSLIGWGYRVHRATSELKQMRADILAAQATPEKHGLSSQAEPVVDNGTLRDR